jgi:hypothetical protein
VSRRRDRATAPVAPAATVHAPADAPTHRELPAQPAKHPYQLAIASTLMLAWLVFLAAMALG